MMTPMSLFAFDTGETHRMNLLKRFALRGTAVDVVIALVLGAAFGALVTALVKDLIGPMNCP